MSTEAMRTAEEFRAGLASARGALRERQLALIAYVLGLHIEEVERLSGR